MSEPTEVAVPTTAEPSPDEPAEGVITIDADPSNWTIAEQMAYREKVGVNPHFAMNRIGRAMQTEDPDAEPDEVPEAVLDIPPAYLLGLLWVTKRRTDRELSYEALADKVEYGALLNAVIAWGLERFAENPPSAPKKRTARRK